MTKKVSFLRKYAGGGMTEQPAAPMPPSDSAAQAPAEEGAGSQDQMMQQLSQVIQTQDANMALEFCNQLGQAAGIAPGGEGGEPQEAAPEPAIPAQHNGGQIGVFAKGGKIKMSAKDKMLAAKNGQNTK